MTLYPILKDRASINILKILYDNEYEKKYTMTYTAMKNKLTIPENPFTLPNLEKSGLITLEDNGSPGTILAITKKGKLFIDQFDQLKLVLDNKLKEKPKRPKKLYQIKYDLKDVEQQALLTIQDLTREGAPVTSTVISKTLFPRTRSEKKKAAVKKAIKHLHELNLLEKIKKSRRNYYDITPSGERVIKEQIKVKQ